MSHSERWHLKLGPFDFRIGIRSIQLGETLNDPGIGLPDLGAAGALPVEDPLAVGRIRIVEDETTGESEGGSLGHGDRQSPGTSSDLPRETGRNP